MWPRLTINVINVIHYKGVEICMKNVTIDYYKNKKY